VKALFSPLLEEVRKGREVLISKSGKPGALERKISISPDSDELPESPQHAQHTD